MTVFDKAYDLVLGHEGGYVNDPDDPGGETYKGVARNRWPHWSGWRSIDDIKSAYPREKWNKAMREHPPLQDNIKDFYRGLFWDAIWGDELAKLSPALATDMFDMAVNLGTGRATEFIQRACNALNNRGTLYPDIAVDGSFGPKTITAVRLCVSIRKAELLYKVVNILQGNWYLSLMERNPVNEKYIGWFKRVDFMQEQS